MNRIQDFAPLTNYPFRTIGKLFFKQYGSNYVCSASVIGPNGIITAGHCIHKGNNSAAGWSTNIVFVPAYNNGAAPYGQWTVSGNSIQVMTAWYASGDLGRDFGAAKMALLNGVKIGNKVGYLGYAWNYSREQHWWLLGYPAASPYTGKYMHSCQASYAYNSPFGTQSKGVGVGCNMTGGCSGGPWIVKLGTNNYVNGVNSHRTSNKPNELFSSYVDSTNKTIFDNARAY